jgi:hypothetical protein
MHVLSGPNAGVAVVWGGGTTVIAHRGSGLAAMFKKTFALHDPQATTIRGSSIDQLSFGAILLHGAESDPLARAPTRLRRRGARANDRFLERCPTLSGAASTSLG